MKRLHFSLFQLLALLLSVTIHAQLVSTNATLATAITNATAGTTITLANGTWTNVQISIQKTGTTTTNIFQY